TPCAGTGCSAETRAAKLQPRTHSACDPLVGGIARGVWPRSLDDAIATSRDGISCHYRISPGPARHPPSGAPIDSRPPHSRRWDNRRMTAQRTRHIGYGIWLVVASLVGWWAAFQLTIEKLFLLENPDAQ